MDPDIGSAVSVRKAKWKWGWLLRDALEVSAHSPEREGPYLGQRAKVSSGEPAEPPVEWPEHAVSRGGKGCGV